MLSELARKFLDADIARMLADARVLRFEAEAIEFGARIVQRGLLESI
jgi:hypothetical protein